MEDFPRPRAERRIERRTTDLIEVLKSSAPEETAMRDLSSQLDIALRAARSKNSRVMHEAFERAYEQQNMLAKKGVDVLVELEQVTEEIKAVARA